MSHAAVECRELVPSSLWCSRLSGELNPICTPAALPDLPVQYVLCDVPCNVQPLLEVWVPEVARCAFRSTMPLALYYEAGSGIASYCSGQGNYPAATRDWVCRIYEEPHDA